MINHPPVVQAQALEVEEAHRQIGVHLPKKMLNLLLIHPSPKDHVHHRLKVIPCPEILLSPHIRLIT